MQKTASVVRIRHKPTGLSVTVNSRDQHSNRRIAMRMITAMVNDRINGQSKAAYDANRKSQTKMGRGGDKVRTYSFVNGLVIDHVTGRRTNDCKGVMKGDLGLVR